MSDQPATREEFDAAVSAAPAGLSQEQFHAFVDQEVKRRRVATSSTGLHGLLTPHPKGTAPDDSGPSPLMESLGHLAHPQTTGDVLGLVIPSAGAELVRPALRMMGTAYRYAKAEPKVEGILGGVRGAMRGAWKGMVEEASAPNQIEKFRGPRDVPVASEPVQVQPKTPDAWDRAKAAGSSPATEDVAKAEAKRLKDLRAANAAQFKHEEGVAAKKAADAKAANALQFKATEATAAQRAKDARAANVTQFRHEEGVATEAANATKEAERLRQEGLAVADKAVADAEKLRQEGLGVADKAVETAATQHQRDLLESGKMADKAIAEAGKTLTESERAAKIAEQMAGREAGTPAIRETVKAGDRTMTTSHTLPDEADAVAEAAATPPPEPTPGRTVNYPPGKGPVRIVAKEAPKTAEFSYIDPLDKQPRFKTAGRSDLTAAQVEAQGGKVGEVPTGATPEDARAARDAALARQASKVAKQKAIQAPNPAEDPAYLAHLEQDAIGRIPPKSTAPAPVVDRPISPRDPITGNTAPPPSVEEAANEAARARATEKYLRGIRGDKTPVTSTTETPLAAGQEIGSRGAQEYMQSQFDKNNGLAQQILGRDRVGGPALSPMEDAILARTTRTPLTPQQATIAQEYGLSQEVLDQIAAMRAKEGSVPTGKHFGMSKTDVSLADPGEPGVMPTGGGTRAHGMADIDARILAKFGKNPTKAQLIEYLRRSQNANPALLKYLNGLIDQVGG